MTERPESDQVLQRRANFEALVRLGVPVYRNRFATDATITEVVERHGAATGEALDASPVHVTVAGRILAMRTKEDDLFGVAVVLYDVTRFRLLDAIKTNLVATVSHELKTPLTSVRMVLHILLERTVGSLSPKQSDLLTTAREDTERLLRILNNLLDLARLEEGTAGLQRERVFPSELVQRVMDELVDKVAAKGLRLKSEVQPDLPAVLVDRQRIDHVFTNLITNAIKHSPRGGEIVLGASRTDENSVEFCVTDQGLGVPEEYRTLIFDRFFRVPGQANPGAGLGLSIAKEIAIAHGGRIGVKNAEGQGSRFYVILDGA